MTAAPTAPPQRAHAVGAELGGVDILERAGKSGLGTAYRAGFSWGLERGYDHFVEIDCDFSHDPRALPKLLEVAEEYEVVIGSRYIKGGHIPNWKLSRRLLSRGGNEYASLMLGLHVADSTSGYRVYSDSALEKIDFTSVTAGGYGFQIEMTYRARSRGATIIEFPITFKDRERGESKMSQAIVVEALVLVTQWALERWYRRAKSVYDARRSSKS